MDIRMTFMSQFRRAHTLLSALIEQPLTKFGVTILVLSCSPLRTSIRLQKDDYVNQFFGHRRIIAAYEWKSHRLVSERGAMLSTKKNNNNHCSCFLKVFVFTVSRLQGLRGRASLDRDHFVSLSELLYGIAR